MQSLNRMCLPQAADDTDLDPIIFWKAWSDATRCEPVSKAVASYFLDNCRV